MQIIKDLSLYLRMTERNAMSKIDNTSEKQWDVFISHASEDKDEVVRPLAHLISQYGARVWYDEFELRIGKSLSRSIDRGIAQSRFGIIVLSGHFLAKDWPEYELKSLNAIELGNDGVMLPVWHGVTREQILAFSPALADKLALDTKKIALPEIAVKILDVIRPDLFIKVLARRVWKEMLRNAEVKTMAPEEIKEGPIRHLQLSGPTMVRIRLIRAALLRVLPMSYREWVDGFRRDLHPETEVTVWERIATVFLEMNSEMNLSREEQKLVLSIALQATTEDWKDVLNGAEIRSDLKDRLASAFTTFSGLSFSEWDVDVTD